MASSQRISSLDGIRGWAALVVVTYHCSLIAMPHLDGTLAAWLTQSPSKLAFAGTEAVLVFFVLSGFVVALPVLRDGFSWTRYYPTRVLRLYLPVWGSVVLATALIALLPRDAATMPEDSWMQNTQATRVTWGTFFDEALLLTKSYDINNVLWSLRWELIFSLALPVFVGLALLLRRHAMIAAAVACALTVVGRIVDVEALVYLPVFMLGTLMAVRLDDLLAWVQRPRRRAFWPCLTALALALLIASWLARPVAAPGTVLGRTMWGLAGVGAVLVIVAAMGWPRLRHLLEGRVSQWLGRTSYSLYLVHVPLLGTLAYLWGSDRWAMVAVVGIPASLLLAAAFHRFLEAPAHRLARYVGTVASERLPLTRPNGRIRRSDA
ncbi:acyltransferase family protein [Microbacterium abyssi]|uniref:acyltransferase family protein n=1 Tax=Microbacterium abyssi TaxID=2782166 RepID=UPI00188983B5|nr:acyltransferase [Microbacterium sp. A18JL241]